MSGYIDLGDIENGNGDASGESDTADRDRERDDFWDVDKLVPRKHRTVAPFMTSSVIRDHTDASDTSDASSAAIGARGSAEMTLVTVTDDGAEQSSRPTADSEQKRLSFCSPISRGVRTSESEVYYPEGGLIKSVTVHHFIDKYDFYDNFRKSAEIFFDYRTQKCEFAQFYSYMPQYSQLTREQKNYYFYWRDELRRGRYIKTDYSYVYLYVYEILNLPDRIPPSEGLELLCRLWREYRAALPRLDNYFSIWVQDYCLVHRLQCPTELIGDFLFDIISVCPFKEFYLSSSGSDASHYGAMLAFLSDYDWRRSKYACGAPLQPQAAGDTLNAKSVNSDKTASGGFTAEQYRAHMCSAMGLVLSDVIPRIIDCNGGTQRERRDAFPNSLCTHMVKRKLEIEYYPINGSQELRRSITAAVKYTENKLRALMGVKSRLAVKDLPDDYRAKIDGYFSTEEQQRARARARESLPEYERLYDAPRESLSFDGADEIERLSWGTTARLVDDEQIVENVKDKDKLAHVPQVMGNSGSLPPVASVETATQDSIIATEMDLPATEQSSTCDNNSNIYGLDGEELTFLTAVAAGEHPDGADVDSLAERVNEKFADGFGDIILEHGDDGYMLIEDYEEEINEWLRKIS